MLKLRTYLRRHKYLREFEFSRFLVFLGVTEKRLEKMNFVSLASLPNMKKLGVRALGGGTGRHRPVKHRSVNKPGWLKRDFVFMWNVLNPMPRRPRAELTYTGFSSVSYDHAAVYGLLVIFELLTYRHRQHGAVNSLGLKAWWEPELDKQKGR